jgi:hypothetical protein
LDYLRGDPCDLSKLTSEKLERLQKDAEFYQLDLVKVNHHQRKEEGDRSGRRRGQRGVANLYQDAISVFLKKSDYTIEFGRTFPRAEAQMTPEFLLDGNKNTGVCLDNSTPWIIFAFHTPKPLSKLRVLGYFGNTANWTPSNGTGAKILYSMDRWSWVDSNIQVPDLQSRGPAIIELGFTARYIKFQHNDHIGFSMVEFKYE